MAGNKIIAIDLGGTFLRTALVKGKTISKYNKIKTPKNKKKLLDLLVSSISELMGKDIKGIGIACPGPLSNGVVKNPPNLVLQNFNLQKYIQKKFHKKTKIINDANCVALAEAKYGCKKKNFFILTLGTGIGGGIIINKQIYDGNGYAGEFSHMVNNGKYLEEIWQARSKKNYLAQAIASLISVLDPEIIVLTGGGVLDEAKFIKRLKKQVKKYIYIPDIPNIVWSKIRHPGILGASLFI